MLLLAAHHPTHQPAYTLTPPPLLTRLTDSVDAFEQAPEAAMRADLARLQGEKAEAEARVAAERSEKNKALLEKDQAGLEKLRRLEGEMGGDAVVRDLELGR